MYKKIGILALSLLLILANSSLLLAASNQESSPNIITAIEVVGNKNISKEEILAKINTKVGDEVSNQKLQEDMQLIFDIGYFFDVRVSFKNYQEGVKLIFEVIENPKLSEIKIKGNKTVTDEVLKTMIPIKSGQLLNLNQLDQATKKINQHYKDQGAIFSRVVDVTIGDRDKLYIVINESQINKIKINTDGKTKDNVIRRELTMEPGQVFNLDQMWQDLRQVYNLGFFKNIEPDVKPVGTDGKKIDIIINLEEAKTNTFSFGGGYSSSAGLNGMLNLDIANLMGNGQSVRLNWEFGNKETNYEVGLYEPWAFGTETSLDFKLYSKDHKNDKNNINETEKKDADIHETGAEMTIGKSLDQNTSGYLTFSYDDTEYYSEEEEKRVNKDTRSISLKTVRDTRNNLLNTRLGSRQELSIEKAGFGGDTNYTKYHTDLRKYIPSGDKNSWALRLKVGSSDGDLADHKNYKLRDGLLDGIRGYDSEYYSDKPGFEGNSMLLSSLEYRVNIADNVTGVLFNDIGKAFEDKKVNLDNLNYSVGAGVRFNTPIGQLGLDYGYAPEGDDDHKTSFSFRIGNSF